MSRDDLAAKLAGWVYSKIATKNAQQRLIRVLRAGAGEDEERVPVDQVIISAAVVPTTTEEQK